MGVVLIPIILVIGWVLATFGDYCAQTLQSKGRGWKSTSCLAILATIPVGIALFALPPIALELDPIDGTMSSTEVFWFASVWTAYSSVFWAPLIALSARARQKRRKL